MYVPFDEFIGATGQGPIITKYQLSPTCTLLASAREFSGHFLQTTIINGGKLDSKILRCYITCNGIPL
jgi:hypothetical protein